MSVILVGNNPAAVLYQDGVALAGAAWWSVEWSIWGPGDVLLYVDAFGWRAAGLDNHLARILIEEFAQDLAEFAAFPAPENIQHMLAPVQGTQSLMTGVEVHGGGIELELADILDRRFVIRREFPVGSRKLGVSNVFAPCRTARIRIDGRAVSGQVIGLAECGGPSSSAYLAGCEVWTAGESDPGWAMPDR